MTAQTGTETFGQNTRKQRRNGVCAPARPIQLAVLYEGISTTQQPCLFGRLGGSRIRIVPSGIAENGSRTWAMLLYGDPPRGKDADT